MGINAVDGFGHGGGGAGRGLRPAAFGGEVPVAGNADAGGKCDGTAAAKRYCAWLATFSSGESSLSTEGSPRSSLAASTPMDWR